MQNHIRSAKNIYFFHIIVSEEHIISRRSHINFLKRYCTNPDYPSGGEDFLQSLFFFNIYGGDLHFDALIIGL